MSCDACPIAAGTAAVRGLACAVRGEHHLSDPSRKQPTGAFQARPLDLPGVRRGFCVTTEQLLRMWRRAPPADIAFELPLRGGHISVSRLLPQGPQRSLLYSHESSCTPTPDA